MIEQLPFKVSTQLLMMVSLLLKFVSKPVLIFFHFLKWKCDLPRKRQIPRRIDDGAPQHVFPTVLLKICTMLLIANWRGASTRTAFFL